MAGTQSQLRRAGFCYETCFHDWDEFKRVVSISDQASYPFLEMSQTVFMVRQSALDSCSIAMSSAHSGKARSMRSVLLGG